MVSEKTTHEIPADRIAIGNWWFFKEDVKKFLQEERITLEELQDSSLEQLALVMMTKDENWVKPCTASILSVSEFEKHYKKGF